MKKLFLALSITLASCSSFPGIGTQAPLAATTIDEKGLILALETFDTVLTGVDRLIAAGVIVPGSPTAIKIADAIAKAKVALQAASAAQRAGNASGYVSAINDAKVAIASINVLMKGN